MSSPPTIELFKGTNWEECDEFIRAIRAAAWKEGKLRNPGWMADLASLHFSRKALSWYSRLPQDIQEDWAKLQVALLDRWAPPEDDDERFGLASHSGTVNNNSSIRPPTEPTPAAAPSLNRSDIVERPLTGALKVVIDGLNTNYYFKLRSDRHGYCSVTDKADEALRFRCSSLPNTTILERIDGSRHSWLAIQWTSSDPNMKTGSTDYGYLVLVDSLTLKTFWGRDYPYRLAACTLSTDGEVIPVWENSDTSKIAIGIFRDGNEILCVAADPDAYSKKYPREKRARIFIEPIE